MYHSLLLADRVQIVDGKLVTKMQHSGPYGISFNPDRRWGNIFTIVRDLLEFNETCTIPPSFIGASST